MKRIKLLNMPGEIPPPKFLCPDGQTIDTAKCLKDGGCRMGERCKPLPYLAACVGSGRRKTSNIPSVTELVANDPMYSYLAKQCGSLIDPDGSAYSLFGTAMHAYLDKVKHPGVITEAEFGRLTYDDIFTGQLDCLVIENNQVEIVDFKVVGHFQIKKFMGMTGSKAKGFEYGKPDFGTYAAQLNAYKLLVEKNTKYKVTKLSIFAIVRDGGLWQSKSAGVDRKTYYFDIPIYSKAAMLKRLKEKSKEYKRVMETGEAAICAPHLRWDNDKKCKEFCGVKDVCPYGKML